MKKILFMGVIFASITACSTAQTQKDITPKLGMPNPASKHCVDLGGKLSIKNETNGQVGYCHLPNGQVIEEWELFRKDNAECVSEEAKKLVGLQDLTEEQIKEKTQSSIVRTVKPGQPVTMDYRIERVTVTIDPATKKILTATCG